MIRRRILLVEDEPGLRRTLADLLIADGYTVESSADGLAGQELAAQNAFDLIILDVMLPSRSGFEVCRHLRKNGVQTPILMLTARSELNNKVQGFKAGADDYLTKPFNPTMLRARIGACLEKKRLRDQEQQTYLALLASQKQLAAELAEAGAYVRSLLPEPIVTGDVRVDWSFQPSTQLGGDAFGYYWLDDDHFAIYLIDVCGHGVGAALLSVSVMNALRSGPLLKDHIDSPAAVLGELNRMFPMEAQNQQYFTAWLGIYRKSSNQIAYASAGHPPAILCSPDGKAVELRTPTPPIGAFPDAVYKNKTADVPPGSRLYVFSDGVYEIARPDGSAGTLAEFGASLAAAQPDCPPEHWLATARSARGDSGLDDDFSLLRARFPG